MANCNQCGKDVGCGCNLINGSCLTCYNKNLPGEAPAQKKKTKNRVVYNTAKDVPPNNEFSKILHTPGLSREEKLKRINDILEKARQQIQNDNQP